MKQSVIILIIAIGLLTTQTLSQILPTRTCTTSTICVDPHNNIVNPYVCRTFPYQSTLPTPCYGCDVATVCNEENPIISSFSRQLLGILTPVVPNHDISFIHRMSSTGESFTVTFSEPLDNASITLVIYHRVPGTTTMTFTASQNGAQSIFFAPNLPSTALQVTVRVTHQPEASSTPITIETPFKFAISLRINP
jgi:hypothetical protein